LHTALILAGGLGRRLRPLTYRIPKPMIKVGGKPIIFWQLELLKKHGVRNVVVLAGYKAGAIIDAIGDGSSIGMNVLYSVEEEPLGTAGAVRKAFGLINTDTFYVLNGDVITNIDLTLLREKLDKTGLLVAMAAVPLTSPYGILVIDEDHIVDFKEKPVFEDIWINAGIYIMRREIENYLPRKGNLEDQVFPELARDRKLAVQKYPGAFWRSIDSHKDVEEVDKILKTKSPL
jgi:mannose-1-phosphate guanylyltransferase